MEIDYSTAHKNHGDSTPPSLGQSMAMLRGTLESTGELQINVQDNYVVLAALKALNDCGYKIYDGSSINLSRPVRKTANTILSEKHRTAIEDLVLRLTDNDPQAASDFVIAANKPGFDDYLIDQLIAMVMANHARAVDGHTFKTIADELAFMTSLTVATVGTGKDWGLPCNSSLTTLVVHVLDYYHNAWYRRLWRRWVSLFTPSRSNLKPGPGAHDENTMEGK